jgi:HK97 family phage major capsid protein
MPNKAGVVAGAFKAGERVRSVEFSREAVDPDARTAAVVFSSEALVDRGGYYEVLSHEPGAIRGGRLDRGMAVLVNHEPADHVGVVESWTVGQDRRGRASLRFGVGARAAEIFEDVKTGIRSGVSVRYVVHDFREETAPDGLPLMRVTDWEPTEISLASVPADIESAVGRTITTCPATPGGRSENMSQEQNPAPAASVVDVREVETRTRAADLARVNEIMAIGDANKLPELARHAIATGQTLDDFRRQALDEIGKRQAAISSASASVGMTEKEIKRYSFVRAIRALANTTDRGLQEAAAFEFDCSRAAQDSSGRTSRGIMVPHDVTTYQRAVMIAGTANVGGYLKETAIHAESFIDALRNRCVVLQAGATEMGGLVGDVAIPRIDTVSTATWVGEDTAHTQTNPVLGQMALTPRQVGAYSDISKKLLAQSTPAADMIVQNDLALALATAIDRAAFHGTGTLQPLGIAGATGTGITGVSASYTGATDGASPTYAHLVGVESALAGANGDVGKTAWITNASVRGKLRQIFTNATYGSQPLFTNVAGSPGEGEILGYRCLVTNQVANNVTRGASTSICSFAFLGDWSALVVGMWTGVDLLVDPYSLSTRGQVRVVAIQLADVNLRQAGAMAFLGGILTT